LGAYVLALVIVLGILFASFVTIKNKQASKGDAKRKLEFELKELDQEIELLADRLASLKTRSALEKRMGFRLRQLISIEPYAVLRFEGAPEPEGRKASRAGYVRR